MTPAVASLRCLRHPGREAAARCPACRQFFCRECVAEHEGRLLCAGCLRAATAAPAPRARRLAAPARAAAVLAGLAAGWLAFVILGEFLLRRPAATHADTLWRVDAPAAGTDAAAP